MPRVFGGDGSEPAESRVKELRSDRPRRKSADCISGARKHGFTDQHPHVNTVY